MLLRFFDLMEHPAESFADIFTTAKERTTATEALGALARSAYQNSHPVATYKRVIITTKQLLQKTKSQTVCKMFVLTEWPDYVLKALQQDGNTKEGILMRGQFPLEVHIVDQQRSIVYWLPHNRDLLFPYGFPAPARAIKREQLTHPFSHDIYCKYLLKGKCHHCGASPAPGSKLQACSSCKTASYCGRGCQAADWPEHKTVCKMLQPLKEVGAAQSQPSSSSSSTANGSSSSIP